MKVVKKNLINKKENIEKKYTFNLQSSQQRAGFLKKHLTLQDFPLTSTDTKQLKILISEKLLTEEGIKIAEDLLEYKPTTQKLKQLEAFVNGDVHPNFRVLGTPTNRMAGTDGINFQGVSKEDSLRSLVLAEAGGDFDNLEIVIAATFFNDEKLLEIAKNGDMHTMTAKLILTDCPYNYEELMEIKKDKEHPYFSVLKKARNKAKGINFAILYFAGPFTIAGALGVDEQEADKWMEEHFFATFPSLKETRKRFYDMFCTADFLTWNKNSVANMHERVEDIWGKEKFICLEKAIAKFFWENSDSIAKCAANDNEKILRQPSKGLQTNYQAIRSACLGAASRIQKSVYRQLGNFPIQSSGATLTKIMMARLFLCFDLALMNIHDELIISNRNDYDHDLVKGFVDGFLNRARTVIPHLKMEWKKIDNWSEK